MAQLTPPSTTAIAARHFRDSVGVTWTIYLITPQSLLEGAATLLPHAERRQGWLLFESAEGERRRLTPFPPDWASVTPFELERWCMRATPIEEQPERRATDR